MMLRKWDDLPEKMKCPEVYHYYVVLSKKRISLLLKRLFDISAASVLLVLLMPVMLILGFAVLIDSKGPVLFRQVRITTCGKEFKILKFRSMVNDADSSGGQLTTSGDMRVTRVGKTIRGLRLDELPQLMNIIVGDMSFVGTRPEVPRYVDQYSPPMLATLLLPAGVTSEASILFKNEYKLLGQASDVGKTYVEKVLPGKMYYNLNALERFSLLSELRTLMRTVLTICGKEYAGDYEARAAQESLTPNKP